MKLDRFDTWVVVLLGCWLLLPACTEEVSGGSPVGSEADASAASDTPGSPEADSGVTTPDASTAPETVSTADTTMAAMPCDLAGSLRCFGGLPQVCQSGEWTDQPPCPEGEMCMDGACIEICVPACDDRECGEDGCGGSCGECEDAEATCEEGLCVVEVCEPQCTDKVCGPDACGATCGSCEVGELCAPDGTVCVACGPAEMLDCQNQCVATVSYADGNCDVALACALLLYDGGDCPEDCPPGQLIGCNGTCTLESWLGNGACDSPLNCEELGYDGGDCDVPCEVGTTQDCLGGCSDVTLLGNGECDDAFSCADHGYDAGDCEITCDEGKMPNCTGGCTTDTWLGDDFCDNSLNCEAFEWDQGDCCPPGEEKGCDDVCASVSLRGNGECDEAFNCVLENFDDGDCPVVCPEEQVENCESGCTYVSWMGDGICDSKLNCEELNWDDEDCEPCYPDCDAKNCGGDGCGGTCGVCDAGLICGEDQVCAEPGQGSNCSDPFVVGSVPWTGSGDTKLAAGDYATVADACPGVPNAYGSGSNDHVYLFTPEVSGVYTATVTAEFDSLTYVAKDCDDIGSTCLGAEDAIGAGVEEVVFPVSAGETAYIFVDGWSNVSNASGAYTIDVSAPCFPSCEGKVCGADSCGSVCGTCADGQSCVADGSECVDNSLIPGNTCVNPFHITEAPAEVQGDTSGASNDLQVPEEGGCEGTGSTLGKASFDQVWRFVPPQYGTYTITLDADFDSALYVFTDCDDIANSCLGAKDTTGVEVVKVPGDPNQPMFIIVDGWSSTTNLVGPYSLSISEPCLASCGGKACGSDGCGGTCGTCGEGEGCDPVGQCLPYDQLPGNTCDNPVAITEAPMFLSGETTAATNDFSFDDGACTGLSGARGGASNDRVHAFTAPVAGVYDFGLEATFDTVLYVIGDCADAQNSCLGAHDTVGATEHVLVSLEAGQVVYVVVDGWSDYSNTSGEYMLSVSEPCTPSCEGKLCGDDGCGSTCGECLPGYLCDEAQTCQAADEVQGNVCMNPFIITTAPYQITGTTLGFTPNYHFTGGSCPGESAGMGSASNDVTYQFTAPVTASYSFTLVGEYDSLLYVVDDCLVVNETCHGASDVFTGADETVQVALVAGQTVFLIVDGYSNYSNYMGTYSLTVAEPCIPSCAGKQCGDDGCGLACGECAEGDICDANSLCLDAASIPGNVCQNPLTIQAGSSLDGDTSVASNTFTVSSGSCEGAYGAKGGASRDLVYRFDVSTPGVYEAKLSSDFDAALYVVTACEDVDASCLGGADSAIIGDEIVSFSAEPGQSYYLIVDGWSNTSDLFGTFTLSIAEPCIQQCDGKVCGDDGCGQSCGTCPGFETCNNDGQCEACEPECDGKACGDDACGGSCGECAEGEGCTDQGQCSGGASCAGVCGGAGDGCYCDEFCFDGDDCCDDICDVCLDDASIAAKCN